MARRKISDVKAQSIRDNQIAKDFIERGDFPIFADSSLNYEMIPVDKLRAWQKQPRTFFDDSALTKLAKTIEMEGFKYPLLVRPVEDGYEVIAGERRLIASKMANLEAVPCIIQSLDDQQALISALSENLLRENLNPIEVVNSLLRLLTQTVNLSESEVISVLNKMKYQYEKDTEKDINILFLDDSTQSQIIKVLERFGYNWYSFVCNQLKLRNLPVDIYEAISVGKIEYSKGLQFKSIKDEQIRKSLLEQAITQRWSQKRIAEEIKKVKVAVKEKKTVNPDQELSNLNKRLKKVQPWKTNPTIWKKIKSRLDYIDTLVQELERLE